MPEGHTIHRRARDHARWLMGNALRVSSPQGRFSDGAAMLDGTPLVDVKAIGKHLLYQFPDAWVHVHLGLFGKFRVYREPAPEPRNTVRLRLSGNGRVLDLTGPTACEIWDDSQVEALRQRIGPDPLDPNAGVERFRAALQRRRRAIGAVLLDQRAVAGIGNVYRAELLFRAKLNPATPANKLTQPQVDSLWSDMVAMLRVGATYDRIITVDRSHIDKPPSQLRRSERLYVYKRGRCRICDSTIRTTDSAGRRLYFCPSCQQ